MEIRPGTSGRRTLPDSRVCLFVSVSSNNMPAARAPRTRLLRSRLACASAFAGKRMSAIAPLAGVSLALMTCNGPLTCAARNDETSRSRPYCHVLVCPFAVARSVGDAVNFCVCNGTRWTKPGAPDASASPTGSRPNWRNSDPIYSAATRS